MDVPPSSHQPLLHFFPARQGASTVRPRLRPSPRAHPGTMALLFLWDTLGMYWTTAIQTHLNDQDHRLGCLGNVLEVNVWCYCVAWDERLGCPVIALGTMAESPLCMWPFAIILQTLGVWGSFSFLFKKQDFKELCAYGGFVGVNQLPVDVCRHRHPHRVWFFTIVDWHTQANGFSTSEL